MIRRATGSLVRRWRYLQQRRRLAAFFRPLVKPGDLCFDIGANEGQWTRAFLSLGASVVAVEPQPDLCRRFLLPLDAQVESVAVGAAEGEATLHLAKESSAVAHVDPRWQQGPFAYMTWDKTITVPVVTLDSLIARHGVPDVCKIDVEGFELEVLHGLSVALPLMSFEFQSAFPEIARACLERVSELGEHTANFMPGDSGAFMGEWVPVGALFDKLVRSGFEVGDIFVRRH